MCIGDSITMGADLQGGWRRLLHNMAPNLEMVGSLCVVAAGYTVGQHEGVNGARIATLVDEVVTRIADYDPEIVLLMAGTNDIGWDDMTVQQITDAYVDLAKDIRAEGVDLTIVGSICPRPAAQGSLSTNTTAFNAGLSAAFASLDRIAFYDVCGALTEAHLTDGVHPTAAGDALIAQGWYDALWANGIVRGRDGRGMNYQRLWGYA